MIDWSEGMIIGVESIDMQHRTFVDLAKRIDMLRSEGATRGELRSIVAGLSHYADCHFRDEEEHMRNSGYPYLEKHALLHKAASQKIHDFMERNLDNNDLYHILSVFITKWLSEHIAKHDTMYGRWLADNGLL